MKRKTVTIEYDGFHGHVTARIRPVGEGYEFGLPVYYVGYTVAKYLNNRACGYTDCKCNSVIARMREMDYQAGTDDKEALYAVSKEHTVLGAWHI